MSSWIAPLGVAALHGPAGEFVELVEPHTERTPPPSWRSCSSRSAPPPAGPLLRDGARGKLAVALTDGGLLHGRPRDPGL